MGMDTHWDEVHAVGPEGTAAQQAPGAQSQAAPEAVHGERLDRVGRTTRIEAAGRDPARGCPLVRGDQGHRHPYGQAVLGFGAGHATTLSRPALRSAVSTSPRNTEGSTAAAPGSSRTR